MIRTCWLPLLMLAAFVNTAAWGAESDEVLQKIVVEAGERFKKAFAKQDAKAIAALFTEQAEMIDEGGTVFHGRAAIEAEYAAQFEATPAGAMTLELMSIRPVADGVLVEEGVTTFTPKETGPTRQTRYTATHVRQKSGWLLASVRELESAALTPHERLQSLAWLLGDWHEDVHGSAIATTWNWTEDENFLLSHYTISRAGEPTLKGSQRIGWDAERKQFRSWVFNAAGGSGEGWWRLNEDGSWSVSLTTIDVAGVRSSSLVTYARAGKDALAVTQEQLVRDGESHPGSTHRVVRQPPEAKAAAKK